MQDKKLAIVEIGRLASTACAVLVPTDAEPGDAVRFRRTTILDDCLRTAGKVDTFGVISFVFPSGGNEQIVANELTADHTIPEAEDFWKKAEA